MSDRQPIERHPWPPFIPDNPQLIMLGTFPPKPERWSMDFFYPNKINDMWRIMGLIFYFDRDYFWDGEHQCFRLHDIKDFLNNHGIALWDTAMAVRRLKDNASDKFLDIVETIDLQSLLDDYPSIKAVITAGERATGVIASLASVKVPSIGVPVACSLAGHDFELWRMPSSSRAYPLPLDRKADAYRMMLRSVGVLPE